MVSKGEDKYVIWPVYFDKTVSKSSGRKINRKMAIDKPKIEDIARAAKSLGLHPVLENNCSYPSKHWKSEGRILVDKKNKKSEILRQIANRL